MFTSLLCASALGARSFDAAGKITQRRSAKKQVWLAEPYSVFAVAGIADVHVLALRLCAWREVLRCCGKDHAKAQRRRAGAACRAIPVFAVGWYSRFSRPCFAPLRLARGPSMPRERSRKGAEAQEAGVVAEPYRYSQWAGVADGWVLALRLCASREVLRCCGKDHAKAQRRQEAGRA